MALVDKQMPVKDHLRPGQCVWNAVSRTSRPNSKNLRIVPVILTLVNEADIELYAQGLHIQTIRDRVLHRVYWEAFEQGGVLTMRDIGLLTDQLENNLTMAYSPGKKGWMHPAPSRQSDGFWLDDQSQSHHYHESLL